MKPCDTPSSCCQLKTALLARRELGAAWPGWPGPAELHQVLAVESWPAREGEYRPALCVQRASLAVLQEAAGWAEPTVKAWEGEERAAWSGVRHLSHGRLQESGGTVLGSVAVVLG